MEAAIITLLATMIVIMFGGFWRIRSDIADTKADISRVEGNLATEIVRVEGKLTAEIAQVEGNLTAEIVRVEGKLTAEIAQVEGKLTAEIAQVEGKLTAEIVRVEGKLDTDIARMESKLDTYIDTTNEFQTDIKADVRANTSEIVENSKAIAVLSERNQTAPATDNAASKREQLAEATT